MAQGRDQQARICQAWTVEPGDMLANLGVVQERTHVGVFYVFGIRGTVRRLSDGTMDVATFDIVRHSHESVTVVEDMG